MNEWIVSVILEFDEEVSDSVRIIMSEFDKSEIENVYFLKSKGIEYSSLSTDRVISKIKREFAKNEISCWVHVGIPMLSTTS